MYNKKNIMYNKKLHYKVIKIKSYNILEIIKH
jgi:hypothetical protein